VEQFLYINVSRGFFAVRSRPLSNFFPPRLKDAANKRRGRRQVLRLLTSMRLQERERWLAIIIVHAAVHATNDPGVIMHASSASGAGHWISALIFCAFDIGTPFFHSPPRLVCPDKESVRVQGLSHKVCDVFMLGLAQN
jgi:hypothetical protein